MFVRNRDKVEKIVLNLDSTNLENFAKAFGDTVDDEDLEVAMWERYEQECKYISEGDYYDNY